MYTYTTFGRTVTLRFNSDNSYRNDDYYFYCFQSDTFVRFSSNQWSDRDNDVRPAERVRSSHLLFSPLFILFLFLLNLVAPYLAILLLVRPSTLFIIIHTAYSTLFGCA